MFLKLLADEIKSTAKIIITLDISTLVIALAGKLILLLAGDEPSTILISIIKFVQFIVIATIIVISIAPFIIAYTRLSSSKVNSNHSAIRSFLYSKTVCTTLWMIIDLTVATFSYAIFYKKYPFYVDLIFDGNVLLEVITLALLLFIGIMIIVQEYLAVVLGKLIKKSNNLPSILFLLLEIAISGSLVYLIFYSDVSENIFNFMPQKIYDFVSGYGILFALLIIAITVICYETSIAIIKKHPSDYFIDKNE